MTERIRLAKISAISYFGRRTMGSAILLIAAVAGVIGIAMSIAKTVHLVRQKNSTGKIISPAAAGYAPLTLSYQGAKRLNDILDPNSPTGKPTGPSRPALSRKRESKA